MMACFSRRNVSGYYEANAKIHNAINLAAKNPLLTTLYRTVNGRTQLMRFNSNYDEQKWSRAVSEHEQILAALSARDPLRLRNLLQAHLGGKRKAFRRTHARGFAIRRRGTNVILVGRRAKSRGCPQFVGEDEDWLRDVANEMEIEDGVIWVYGIGEDGVLAFTDFGIERLIELIKMATHRHCER